MTISKKIQLLSFVLLASNQSNASLPFDLFPSEIIQQTNNLSTLEQQLISDFKKLDENPEYASTVRENFYKIINENPESLNYDFTKLKEATGIYIATSTDKKFRIYSWNNNSGGTMRFFDQIIQYKGDKKTISNLIVAEDDAQSFISKIYSVKTNKNETIYLTINNSILSTSLVTQSIFAYKIKNNNLDLTKVFKTKKQELSSIHCEFDFFSVVDRPERPVELITLKNNTLKIPLINEKGIVTSKNLIYKWNGNNFIYEGIK
ncbi:hypothetical protein [Flavobacterium sp. I3-2]|uniref:hypothetical protein n=1 Tax=Flavobacterium sp. I3-2 TaxID=2748319 RepID=UPI0015A85DE1|nr:hypothetical protein [Flavobacterium sp. I3-2]